MLSLKKSFSLSKEKKLKIDNNQSQQSAVLVSEKSITDIKRRNFLKTLGLVGAGMVGASIVPKKTQAMTSGAKTGANAIGIKNSTDLDIDPATQGTLDSSRVATEASKVSFDGIKSNTDTLVTNSNKFTFTGGQLNVVRSTGTDIVRFRDQEDHTINALNEDAIVFLRRIVKQMESKATVDVANRRRVTVDAWGDNLSGPIETGTATGTQNVNQLVDTTKFTTWTENKFSYFAVKITAGTGVGQVRMIASNTSTALTLQLPWTTAPDGTSVYGIYDIAVNILDFGVTSGSQGLLTLGDTTKAWTTDAWAGYAVRITSALEGTQIRLINNNSATVLTYATPWVPILGITANLESGTATGAQSVTTFVDTSKTWSDNVWQNYVLVITSGTGIDQAKVIVSNTIDTLNFAYPWLIQPDTSSTYAIRALPTDGLDSGTASSPPSTDTLFNDISKVWTTDVWANYLIKITSGTGAGQIRQIVSNTDSTLTISAAWSILPSIDSTYSIYAVVERRYGICLLPSASVDVGTIAGMPRVGIGTDSTVGTVTSISSMASIGSYAAQQKFGDISHKVYNDSIRSQLTFN